MIECPKCGFIIHPKLEPVTQVICGECGYKWFTEDFPKISGQGGVEVPNMGGAMLYYKDYPDKCSIQLGNNEHIIQAEWATGFKYVFHAQTQEEADRIWDALRGREHKIQGVPDPSGNDVEDSPRKATAAVWDELNALKEGIEKSKQAIRRMYVGTEVDTPEHRAYTRCEDVISEYCS